MFCFRAKSKESKDAQEQLAQFKLEIKGSWSTKMEAVVKTLLRIKNLDPTAKCLVFSPWVDVLDILAAALEKNDINYAALHAQG